MGWAKTDEDIREINDDRMRDSGKCYYGNSYINSAPNYLSKKSEDSQTMYYTNNQRFADKIIE